MSRTVGNPVVEYRETRTFGQYQNVTIGLTVGGCDGDDSEGLLLQAKSWVQDKLEERVNEDETYHQRQRKEDDLNWDLSDIEEKISRAQQRYAEIQEFVAKLGVKLDDMPF